MTTKTTLRSAVEEVFEEQELEGLSPKDSADLVEALVDRIALDLGVVDDEEDEGDEEEE
jgi:hypothetical protein